MPASIPHASRTDYRETTGVTPNLTLGNAISAVSIGLASWGPIAGEVSGGVKKSYTEIPSWPEFKRIYGNFETNHPLAKYAWAYFKCGGQVLYVARTVHFVDPADYSTKASAQATHTSKYTSATATYGTVTCTTDAPYELVNGDQLDFKVDGGGTDSAAFDAAAAEEADTTTYPVSTGTGFLVLKIDRGTAQTITFLGTETTNLEIAATINSQLVGGWAEVAAGQVKIWSDTEGTDSYVEITTNPVANPLLTFPTSEIQGTSTAGVGNIKAVTIAEIKAWVESEVTDTLVTDLGSNRFSVATTTSGSGGSIQVEASSTADDEMGLDNTVHTGSDTTDVDALQVDGKYDGTRGNNLSYQIEAATGGDAAKFDIVILENSGFQERFPDVDDTTVEDEVNHAARGSNLVFVTVKSANNPDTGSYTLITGDDGLTSLDDNDYSGDQEEGTGFYAFDDIENFRLALTDRETAVHAKAFHDYLGTTRKAIGVLLYDSPSGNSYAQARTYMTGEGLKGYGEFMSNYWPYVKWPTPDRNIFGTYVDEVEFPASAAVAGRHAYTSAQRDAGFADEAANIGLGTFPQATGVADKFVNKEWVRNLLYPDLVNPIRVSHGKVYNDGVMCSKIDGNFPTVAQRLTACETASRIIDLLDRMRHKGLSQDGLKERYTKIELILTTLTDAGAYESGVYAEAFEIDDSGNTPARMRQFRYTVRVGIATINPAEFNTLELGYNEQGVIFREVVTGA